MTITKDLLCHIRAGSDYRKNIYKSCILAFKVGAENIL